MPWHRIRLVRIIPLMPQQTYDPSMKWLLRERGPAILWVAGLRGVISCETEQAELVLPRKLPDGLLKAVVKGHRDPLPVLLEVATYPEKRVVEQVCGDLRLVRQVKGDLPEAFVLCLRKKGSYRIPEQAESSSALGFASETLRWKTIHLWDFPATEFLEAPDVGAVPWAALGSWDGPPEVLLQRCRDRIDAEGGDKRESLLTVSQVFARLRFDTPDLLAILGGKKVLRNTPLIQELEAEFKQEGVAQATLSMLHRRFGAPGADIEAGLALVKTQEGQFDLNFHAGTCKTLSAFEEELRRHLPKPRPASTRGKRKKGE